MTITPASVLNDIKTTDVAVFRAIAASRTPSLDRALQQLSRAADRSGLWMGIAGALSCVPGQPRRAAVRGVAAIAVASTAVNVVAKTLVPRIRPDRQLAGTPIARLVRMPTSSSFPSGHSASAFAFASAVGAEMPALSLPLHLLATTVAYSRVHTGVHYPLDTLVGASIGTTAAAVVSRISSRRRRATS